MESVTANSSCNTAVWGVLRDDWRETKPARKRWDLRQDWKELKEEASLQCSGRQFQA